MRDVLSRSRIDLIVADELRRGDHRDCYEVYDTDDHSALGRSPRAEMAGILEATGNRQHTFIPYDWVFQILTLPTTKHGVAKLHCQKGVHINYLDHWNSAFLDAKVEGTEVASLRAGCT